MSLTPEQASVIQEPNESKLVCALPGSGKTHTTVSLAERILSLPNSKILMVTFTNAATNEMQTRVEKRLGAAAKRRVTTKTFAKIMLEQHRQISAGRKLVLGGELSSYVLRVFKKLGICISNLQLYQQTFDEYGRDMHWQPKPASVVCEAYVELQNMLALYNKVDLNTVAREVVWALNAGKIKPLNFTHFIVDEFQDSDPIQYQWLLAHRQDGRYMTVVGDDDQSIYGWRGAVGYQNMIDFKRDFSAKAYLLSTCFRCSPYILGAAQRLVEHNEHRIQKDMRSAKDAPGIVRLAPSSYSPPVDPTQLNKKPPKDQRSAEQKQADEYNYVVDLIEPQFNTWTVLARTNLHLDTLERFLTERGIPALRLGGKSIFDSPNTIALAKLLYGVTHPRKLTELIEGLGWAGECEDTLQVMHSTGAKHGFTAASTSNCTQDMQQLSSRIASNEQSLQRTDGYIASLFTSLRVHTEMSKPQDLKARMGAISLIEKIVGSMKGIIEERARTLYDIASRGSKAQDIQDRNGKVVLCTLTGAKGLEWPKVFIMNINSDCIPSLQAGDKDEVLEKKIEEERRLLYVGMTRAEDELVLHYNSEKPSMFLTDLGLA